MEHNQQADNNSHQKQRKQQDQSDHNNRKDLKQAKDRENPLKAYAVYSSVAIQMIAIIGIGTYAGIKLDEHFGNGKNTWTLILSLTSVCLAIFFVIRRIIAASKDN